MKPLVEITHLQHPASTGASQNVLTVWLFSHTQFASGRLGVCFRGSEIHFPMEARLSEQLLSRMLDTSRQLPSKRGRVWL